MKSLKNVGLTAVLVAAVSVVNAQAGTISLVPVSGALQPFQTPPLGAVAPNDVIPGMWGYLNGNLVLNGAAGANYFVQFTLFGSESGWTNRLRETQGGATFLEEPTDNGDSVSYMHTATGGADDFLKFQFETTPGAGAAAQPILVNGPGPALGGGAFVTNGGADSLRSFYVSFCIDDSLLCNFSGNAITGDIAWLGLDDSGSGANNDHDDWVGVVTVRAVPDGGVTAVLLGAALLGLSVLRKKFNA